MTGDRGSGRIGTAARAETELPSPLPRVIHLVPQSGIGGVETAAATMAEVDTARFSFRVWSMFGDRLPGLPVRLIVYLRTVGRLWCNPPDLLIVSLWRAALVGIAVKLVRRKTMLVLFLHAAGDAHVVDHWVNRLALYLSDKVWADSQTSLETRLGGRARQRGRVISFRITALPRVVSGAPAPNFVFWGRLHPVKRLDMAIRILAGVRHAHGAGRLVLIGPDSGAQAALSAVATQAGLQDCVHFAGPGDLEMLKAYAREASFFILTSELEGMAAAVVEAMQLGLVPVVTPVGDIVRYARDGENAVVISSEAQAIDAVLSLLRDPGRYGLMANRAAAEWSAAPTYRDSVLAACEQVLA